MWICTEGNQEGAEAESGNAEDWIVVLGMNMQGLACGMSGEWPVRLPHTRGERTGLLILETSVASPGTA